MSITLQEYSDKIQEYTELSYKIFDKAVNETIKKYIEIDSKLYILSQKVRTVIEEGRNNQTIIDEWLNLLHRIRIEVKR